MLSIVVAIGKNNEIGKENKLLWHLPEDLKKFKEITNGSTIIMGKNTFFSIGRPLPNRVNIVVSDDNEDLKDIKGIEISNDFLSLIEEYKNKSEEAFIVGGASIYKQTIDIADKMYVSHVEFEDKDADAFFPEIDDKKWKLIKTEEYTGWKFCIYEKIK